MERGDAGKVTKGQGGVGLCYGDGPTSSPLNCARRLKQPVSPGPAQRTPTAKVISREVHGSECVCV